jgi:hypothetical protein
MKQILTFAALILLIFIFWACGSDENPVQNSTRNFDPFALWDTASGGMGSFVQCMAVKDTNLFAGINDAGVYRSTNNGDDWIQMITGLSNLNVHALLVKDTIILAGTSAGVFISTNKGSNWSASTSGMGAIIVRSLIKKDTNIFAGTASGVYVSGDNGASWTGAGLGTYTVTTLCVKGTKLIAGTTNAANGVYRSINNGTNWVRIVDGITGYVVNSIVTRDTNLFAATNGGIFRSGNDSTWTYVNDGLYSVGSTPQVLFVYGSGILAGFGNYEGVYLSLNNGASWVSGNAGLFGLTVGCFTYNGSYLFVGGTNQSGGGAVWRHAL